MDILNVHFVGYNTFFNTEGSVTVNGCYLPGALVGVFAKLSCTFIFDQNRFARGICVVNTIFVFFFVVLLIFAISLELHLGQIPITLVMR